jgi:light-regulated signal transduction histidine kinase (bacteriophytochrome)
MRIAGHGNKFESNQQTETQSFGIGDPSVVIEILRNRLYEHKIRTLVQEYMSNARDAHREVGQKRRIEVVAPTQLEPTFKVRDFGPGISPDRMANVFVLYGASTKRTNNTQTGGFGCSAKYSARRVSPSRSATDSCTANGCISAVPIGDGS